MEELNKIIIDPDFFKTFAELREKNISFTKIPFQTDFDFSYATFPPDGKLSLLEELGSKSLSIKRGESLVHSGDPMIAGYDESTWDYSALEGSAFFTSHSLVLMGEDRYIPVIYLSARFFTRSTLMSKDSDIIIYSLDPESEAKRYYAEEKSTFLERYTPEGTLLYIDGPLIGAQMTSYTVKSVRNMHKKEIIPIFFVKNSTSNLVTDNIAELRGKFNSDLHWSSKTLKKYERTNFFKYVDEHNASNAKVFCYYKVFDDVSTQRIELHIDTYSIIKDRIDEIMDSILYLLLVNGDKKNPQIRPIAVAEMYARAALQRNYCYRLIKTSGLIPTMNQERGFV